MSSTTKGSFYALLVKFTFSPYLTFCNVNMYEQLNTEESGAQFSALCGAHSNFRAPLTLALPKYLVSGARARAPRFQSAARSGAPKERRSPMLWK